KNTPGIRVVPLDDFLGVMLRTALIPEGARNPAASGLMIDFLVQLNGRPELNKLTGLPPINSLTLQEGSAMRPIRLGPGLLVFLDRMRRETFLRSWTNSIAQN
ncbi:MAG: ABC transporter substrate-binding protein, partial [Devosiaceae bacterium]|nr:ABC transporter substrate-binding protein [Devosiaceae bacterium]